MKSLLEVVLNVAMKAERDNVLQARPFERSDEIRISYRGYSQEIRFLGRIGGLMNIALGKPLGKRAPNSSQEPKKIGLHIAALKRNNNQIFF